MYITVLDTGDRELYLFLEEPLMNETKTRKPEITEKSNL